MKRALALLGTLALLAAAPSNAARFTPDDVHRVLRTYIKNVRFAYVGDPTKLDRSVITGF